MILLENKQYNCCVLVTWSANEPEMECRQHIS